MGRADTCQFPKIGCEGLITPLAGTVKTLAVTVNTHNHDLTYPLVIASNRVQGVTVPETQKGITMIFNRFQKIALGVAGVTSLSIGAFVLTSPHAFYASYDIALGADAGLLSELRAFGAGLGALGAVMLAGLFRPAFGQAAIVAAFTVFLAFPAGRLVGLLIDGMPSSGIVAALLFEIAVAAFCLFAFLPKSQRAALGAGRH